MDTAGFHGPGPLSAEGTAALAEQIRALEATVGALEVQVDDFRKGNAVLVADDRKMRSGFAAEKAARLNSDRKAQQLNEAAALQFAELTLARGQAEGLRQELADAKSRASAVEKWKAAKAQHEIAAAEQAAADARKAQEEAEAMAARRHSTSSSEIDVNNVTYAISLATGPDLLAGTAVPGVWIALFGEHGTTGRLKLRNPKLLPAAVLAAAMIESGAGGGGRGGGRGSVGSRARGTGRGKGKGEGGGADRLLAGMFGTAGATDRLEVEWMDLGELTGLEVGFVDQREADLAAAAGGGEAGGWQLGDVVVENAVRNRRWTFAAVGWVGKAAGPLGRAALVRVAVSKSEPMEVVAGFDPAGKADWKSLVMGGIDSKAVALEKGLAWKKKAMFANRRRDAQAQLKDVRSRLDGGVSANEEVQKQDKIFKREQAKKEKLKNQAKIKLTTETKQTHYALKHCTYCGNEISTSSKSFDDDWGDTYCNTVCWNRADDGYYEGEDGHDARKHASKRAAFEGA